MLPDRVSNPGPLTYESGINSNGFLHFALFNYSVQGVSKKTWTYFESPITPSFMEETFQNFLCL